MVIKVQGNQTQPGLVCLNKAAFFRVGEKVDFCGTQTRDLQHSTLMLYLLSQEAHLASTATSSSLRTLPSTQCIHNRSSNNKSLVTLLTFSDKCKVGNTQLIFG